MGPVIGDLALLILVPAAAIFSPYRFTQVFLQPLIELVAGLGIGRHRLDIVGQHLVDATGNKASLGQEVLRAQDLDSSVAEFILSGAEGLLRNDMAIWTQPAPLGGPPSGEPLAIGKKLNAQSERRSTANQD